MLLGWSKITRSTKPGTGWGCYICGYFTDLHWFYISLNKDIFRINADNFINRIMMSSKEGMPLFQQQEKSFVITVPSNLFNFKAWENP